MAHADDNTPLHQLPLPALLSRAQQLRDARQRGDAPARPLRRRLAILGGYTTQFLARILDLMLFEEGIDVEIYQSPHGSMVENILNPQSDLYAFQPELTLLLTHHPDIDRFPEAFDSPERVCELAAREAERWSSYARTLLARTSSPLLQTNFELPAARSLGNHEARVPYGRVAFVRAVNAALLEALPTEVTLVDFDYLTASFGLERALDPRNQYLHKQPLSFAFLPGFCHALARGVAQQLGLSKKCLVLDLDGTLWGGTVGEDGVAGLTLGPDSAEGEAFVAFQRYALALRKRGVLLAVCSKNDEPNAKAVFEEHPHMVLALSDIACFVANWQDKASNLSNIARTLQIGIDSLVFVDNSPEERHLVRQMLPEVGVVELPEDPADYVRALDEGLYFEVSELTAEAALRTDSLVQNQQRVEQEKSFVDFDSYLQSLRLEATVAPLGAGNLARALELIKRTNQFNLRTLRHSASDVQRLLAQPGGAGFCVAIADRFGAYGIVSVVLLERRDGALFVDTWLMSCRVLKKGVERLVLEEILAEAGRQGLDRIEGEYRPTPKNGMVAGLYEELGFSRVVTDAAGADHPRFALTPSAHAAGYARPGHFITRTGAREP